MALVCCATTNYYCSTLILILVSFISVAPDSNFLLLSHSFPSRDPSRALMAFVSSAWGLSVSLHTKICTATYYSGGWYRTLLAAVSNCSADNRKLSWEGGGGRLTRLLATIESIFRFCFGFNYFIFLGTVYWAMEGSNTGVFCFHFPSYISHSI